MTDQPQPENTPRKSRGVPFGPNNPGKPFQPGNAGKPKGTRHKVTRAIETLLAGDAEALTRKCVEMALAGDGTAMRLCMERIAPAPKDTPVQFKLRPVKSVDDMMAAGSDIMAAMAGGQLSPDEAGRVLALLRTLGGLIEVADLNQRIAALEKGMLR